MSCEINIAVIGGGIFGAEVALSAVALGLSVRIFEAKHDLLMGASNNNQNRLHLGFHYPRDLETGRQSIRGFNAFCERYSDCIQGEFPNAYFIASEGSLTDSHSYLEFCDKLDLPFERVDASLFPVEVVGVDVGVQCQEVVYDCSILRQLVWDKIREKAVQVALNQRVVKIARLADAFELITDDGLTVTADVVVNASYGDINRLTKQLGHKLNENLYEYTVVPIIEVNMPRVGVTIMDGTYMTVLPHGRSENFLLYNVVGSVVASDVSDMLNPAWLDPATAPFAKMDSDLYFRRMVESCAHFVPALAASKLVGFLEGPRMVLARKEDTDARPSIVTDYGGGYFSVFAGKIDHSIWVAEDVMSRVRRRFDR